MHVHRRGVSRHAPRKQVVVGHPLSIPQVLTVGTHNGYLHSFLASLPMVYDYNGTRVLYLTSLLEMTIMDVTRRQTVARIELESEPAFCGLGPSHAAMGMNNQVRALGARGAGRYRSYFFLFTGRRERRGGDTATILFTGVNREVVENSQLTG